MLVFFCLFGLKTGTVIDLTILIWYSLPANLEQARGSRVWILSILAWTWENVAEKVHRPSLKLARENYSLVWKPILGWVTSGQRDYPSPSPPPSPLQPLPLPSWKLITVHLIQYKRSKSILSFILVWKSTATIGTLYTPWFKELRYNQLKTFANFLMVSVPPEGSRTLAEAQWGHQYNESTSLSVPFFNVIR